VQVNVPAAVIVTVKSSDSVKGDVLVTQPVQVMVQVADAVAVNSEWSETVAVKISDPGHCSSSP
jgi:hypothetical protein